MHAVIEYADDIGAMYVGRLPNTYEKVWEGEVEADSPLEVCGSLFERFNIGDHGGLQLRSMSVGDVVVVDGVAYLCDFIGWRKVDERRTDGE